MFEEALEGVLKGYLEGDFRGDFKQDLEGDLLSSSGQVRSRSGLVQVWFSLQPKFNSFELDSEVGRLVLTTLLVNANGQSMPHYNSIPCSQLDVWGHNQRERDLFPKSRILLNIQRVKSVKFKVETL